MLREFVIVGLVAIVVAFAWLWLADGGERATVVPVDARTPASRSSPSADEIAEGAAALRQNAADVGDATVIDGAVTAVEEVPGEPTLVSREFIVVGPYQVPVIGAVASFDCVVAPNEPPGLHATVLSDANGRFTVRLVAGARHQIHVEAAGYDSKDWDEAIDVLPIDWDDVVRLDPIDRNPIEGDVVTPEGKTLPSDVLDLLRATGDSGGAPLDPRDSTHAARAVIVFVPVGIATPVRLKNHSFDVRPQTQLTERGEFTLDPQPSGIVGELQLQWCGSILARAQWTRLKSRARLVLDPAQLLASLCTLEVAVTGFGGAVDDKLVTLLVAPYGGCLQFNRRVTCGDDRPLVFARLPAGTYSIAVETTRVLALRRVELEPGKRVVVELDAAVSAALEVVVRGIPDGVIDAGFQSPAVVDEHGSACGPLEAVRDGPPGAFRAALPPGRYFVAFGGEARPIELGAGRTATVEFAWRDPVVAWIELRMPPDPARFLYENVQFWWTVERADGIYVSREFVRMRVDADGKVTWGVELSPGDYRVAVALDGREAAAPLLVREGGVRTIATLTFDP